MTKEQKQVLVFLVALVALLAAVSNMVDPSRVSATKADQVVIGQQVPELDLVDLEGNPFPYQIMRVPLYY